MDAISSSGAKIAFGTYTGTGTYGYSGANNLTFDFTPRVIFIQYAGGSSYISNGILPTIGENYSQAAGITYRNVDDETLSQFAVSIIRNGNTVSWWSTKPEYQLNVKDSVYSYIAIG